MSFTIVTSVSPNYADVLQFCMPSWIKWSGASSIIVNRIESESYDGESAWQAGDQPGESWYANVILRCEAMRDSTLQAMHRGERVLALDIDCVALQDLSGGFSEEHAFSAASWCGWPDINMGVLFFNTNLDYPFEEFLNEMAVNVRERCESLIENPGDTWTAGDEDVWREMLQREEQHVCKLDWLEWNFCDHPQHWNKQMRRHKDKIRIAHIKTRRGLRPAPQAALEKYFPEKL